MGDSPDVTALSAAVTSTHSLLRDAHDGGHGPGAPLDWAALVAVLTPLADLLTDARDVALVAARDARVSWPELHRRTGVPKSTLEHRYLSARARGIA